MRRQTSPRTTQNPPHWRCQYQPSSQCGRVRTEIVLLHLPVYFTTFSSPCQGIFEKFSKFFSSPVHYDKTYDKQRNPCRLLSKQLSFWKIFGVVYRFVRKFRKKIVTFELFTFSSKSCIITMLSAAPTPQHHAQRRIVLAKPQSYEVNAQAFHSCAFFRLPCREAFFIMRSDRQYLY